MYHFADRITIYVSLHVVYGQREFQRLLLRGPRFQFEAGAQFAIDLHHTKSLCV